VTLPGLPGFFRISDEVRRKTFFIAYPSQKRKLEAASRITGIPHKVGSIKTIKVAKDETLKVMMVTIFAV
jgi:hypothetical protein